MKKRLLICTTTVLISIAFMTGCGVGNVNMNSSSSAKHLSASESSKRKASASASSKKATARAQSESRAALGKQYTYGLPEAPDWLQVYEGTKATGVYLSSTKQKVVKLHENAEYHYQGQLPWVGTLSGATRTVGSAATQATMDPSSAFQYNLDEDRFTTDTNFEPFTDAKPKTISAHAFADLKQYYKAVDDRKANELPSKSSYLKALWGSTGIVADSGALKTHYAVKAQYFDKDSLQVDVNSNGYDNSTHVEQLATQDDNGNYQHATKLYVPISVKIKETEVAKETEGGRTNPDYGKSKTVITQFLVIYKLTDQHTWQVDEVDEGDSSNYALDMSQGDWIIQK